MDSPLVSALDTSKAGWYLALCAPAVKPPPFAFIDPSQFYIYAQAFDTCIEDMVRPFTEDKIDLVAGIDGMGFITGTAVARRLGAGFLALRKAGHLCVATEETAYVDYQHRQKKMEIRQNAFRNGTRVLIVDQWIETGGTMEAAIRLIKQQGGVIVGWSCPTVEMSEGSRKLLAAYKHNDILLPAHLQQLLDKHDFDFFPRTIEFFKKT